MTGDIIICAVFLLFCDLSVIAKPTDEDPAKVKPQPDADACIPSPCGPNSACRVVSEIATCSCLRDFIGVPPHCRPECTKNSDCAPSWVCNGYGCRDPCENFCGLNAACSVTDRKPFCSCPSGYTGDPFAYCRNATADGESETEYDVCHPSPCGQYGKCEIKGESPRCSCIEGYFGAPPNCRPECIVSLHCPASLACINQQCRNPCTDLCAPNAECSVREHSPICTCLSGYIGDPFVHCRKATANEKSETVQINISPINDVCLSSPCGPHAKCEVKGDSFTCSCLESIPRSPPYCSPECILNSNCSTSLACINYKCRNPCTGLCGPKAECKVVEHSPICSCLSGYTGDPFNGCVKIE